MASRIAVGASISRLFVMASLGLAVCSLVLGVPADAQQNTDSLIGQFIDPASPGALLLRSGSEVRAFYKYRQFAPAWTVGKQASEAILILRNSNSDGLDPAVFGLSTILADRRARSERKAAQFDVLLTDAMLTYIRAMTGARVDPGHVSRFIALPAPGVPAPGILEGSLAADTLESLPNKLAPPHPEYALLKTGLAQYESQASRSPRRAQIIANMERWRWLPRPFADLYIEVNSADATLKLVKGDEVVFSTRLITGRPSTPTPLFETAINAVTVNPFWDVPGDIAVRELLPKEERHPGYLEARHIVGDRPGGALRQLPGTDNALGRFLMEMPNSYDAYLHDTPQKGLFERSDRHLSHGCMRVENMAELVSLLLADDNDASINEASSAVDSDETRTLPLSHPVPVYVLYWTVVPSSSGSLVFDRDVYGWDSAVLAALNQH